MSKVGQINIEFYVFSEYDPNVLLVGDASNWLHIEDKPAVICITIPGSSKPLEYTYLKNGVNTFNSHNLGITCFKGDCSDETYGEIPDGIYTITVKGSPSTFSKTKYHLKTDRLQQSIDKYLIDLGFRFNEKYNKQRDDILKVRVLLMIAEAHIRQEEVADAKRFYDLAKAEMERIESCKD